ncbi:MAG: twin-arginine translocation signal domain-containing protein [Thermoguttaceae bacterium]
MAGSETRRSFLKTAVAAGGCLALPGPKAAGQTAPQSQPAAAVRAAAVRVTEGAPLMVVAQELSRDANPRATAWGYIAEILERGGVFYQAMAPDGLPELAKRSGGIVLLAGDLRLTSAQRDALTAFVRNGGSVLGVGGASGLNEVFGISACRPSADGWIKVTAADHPVTSGLRSSLHVFGGYAVSAGSASTLAVLETGAQGAKGAAIVENEPAKGRALLLGPDLIFSVVHIQQGVAVLQDGKAPADEFTKINEGELKAEDGLVLDWARDRSLLAPDDGPVFLEPVSDELRELILRSIFYLAGRQGIALPVLWYWPRGLKAVGHISHDTDGNDPTKAAAMLEVMNQAKIKSTWCTLYPGGYPREFYRTLKEQEFEIALHYDAKTGEEKTSWSKENFLLQHRWLLGEAGLERIVSNKNHYTRWEHRLDFFRWCEEVGIQSDQTRGPSKKGTIGFPLGGSQPYYPLDDEGPSPRRIGVLEVNMLTQDLVVVCPAEYGNQLLDSAVRHHGVAHYLFHPAHILKPTVADTICGLVDYGRSCGLEWWKSEEICRWELLRRGVKAEFGSQQSFTVRALQPVAGATLLVLKPQGAPCSITVNGQRARTSPQKVYGFEFESATLDLSGEVKVGLAAS